MSNCRRSVLSASKRAVITGQRSRLDRPAKPCCSAHTRGSGSGNDWQDMRQRFVKAMREEHLRHRGRFAAVEEDWWQAMAEASDLAAMARGQPGSAGSASGSASGTGWHDDDGDGSDMGKPRQAAIVTNGKGHKPRGDV
jgi:hypothetical protein